MKFLVGINLSPRWVRFLVSARHEAVHWSTIGEHNVTPCASVSNACQAFTRIMYRALPSVILSF